MKTCIVADGGSTKTEWWLLRKGKKPTSFLTDGINPYLETAEGIGNMLAAQLPEGIPTLPVDAIYYYGSGASAKDKQKSLQKVFDRHFTAAKIKVNGDLTGAAIGMCGTKPGMIGILGTGSASCFFNGKKITEQLPSLGFMAGDEGSGNYIGKRILQYYAYHTFDGELRAGFEMRFGTDIGAILHRMYHEPYPNRYLASFVPLLAENRGHYMVENIIEDCLNDFIHNNLLKYRQSWKYPLYFTGSVAWVFRDVIANLCGQYELELGAISQSPVKGLVDFHKKAMNA